MTGRRRQVSSFKFHPWSVYHILCTNELTFVSLIFRTFVTLNRRLLHTTPADRLTEWFWFWFWFMQSTTLPGEGEGDGIQVEGEEWHNVLCKWFFFYSLHVECWIFYDINYTRMEANVPREDERHFGFLNILTSVLVNICLNYRAASVFILKCVRWHMFKKNLLPCELFSRTYCQALEHVDSSLYFLSTYHWCRRVRVFVWPE